MKIIINSFNLVISALIVLFISACGSTQQVEQTGINEEDAILNKNFVPGKTSTGACALPTNPKEQKKTLEVYQFYRGDFKLENYESALKNWKWLMEKAPGFRKTPFVDGEVMYKHFIEKESNAEAKQKYIDTLYKLYDERIRCHGEEGLVLQSKGLFIYSVLNDQQTAYPILEKAMNIAGNATSPFVLRTLVNKYRSDIKEGIKTKEDVIPLVDKMKAIAQHNIDINKEVTKYKNALDALNQPLVAIIKEAVIEKIKAPDMNNCSEVVDYYAPKYSENPNEMRILKNYYAKLTSMRCYKESNAYEEIHRTLIIDLNKREPTRATWLQAAIYAAQDKDYPQAIIYYQKAIELESDPIKQADIYNYIATTYRGTKEYQKSAETAQKAISLNPDLGVAYTSLGWAYLGYFNKCGSTKKDKAAVAYVAADMFNKAKRAALPDPKAQDAYNKAYVHFYSTQELFFDPNIKEGDPIKAGCWIKKSSTIRTKK